MGGFVFKREQEDQQDAVDREEEGPERDANCDEGAGEQDQAGMGYQANQTG